jgi:uncharacterized membrane protein
MQTILRSDGEGPLKLIGSFFNNYFFNPFKRGLFGFLAILLILILSKSVSVFFELRSSLALDIWDILLAAAGSFFQISIYFLKRYSSKRDDYLE